MILAAGPLARAKNAGFYNASRRQPPQPCPRHLKAFIGMLLIIRYRGFALVGEHSGGHVATHREGGAQ
jgi:hypothetical protein